MKRHILPLLLMLAVSAAALAGNGPRKNSRAEMGINGNALYVIEYTYNIHGGRDGGRQLVCMDSITFDKRGNYQDKIRRTGSEYTYFSYYFDVNGYPLGWNEYSKALKLQGRTAYLNDRNGNRLERTVFMNEQMSTKETSKYDNDRLVEEQSYNADGSVAEKREYKYDGAGNNIELDFYNAGSELTQRYLYKYDDRGNRIEWRYYDADEFLVALTTYYYDDHDNVIEISSFNYDEHMNWKHSYVYEYDEDDNWVRQTIYRNNTPYQVIEREIAFPADE